MTTTGDLRLEVEKGAKRDSGKKGHPTVQVLWGGSTIHLGEQKMQNHLEGQKRKVGEKKSFREEGGARGKGISLVVLSAHRRN